MIDRNRKHKRKTISVDDLYKTITLDAPQTDSVMTSESGAEITEHVHVPRKRSGVATEENKKFNHTLLQKELSERNNNQMTRNYRYAMDYLACTNLPYDSTMPARLKSFISKYPNIDLSTVLTKEEANLHRYLVNLVEVSAKTKFDGTVYNIGGYGLLPLMLFESKVLVRYNKIRNIDIDPRCQFMADYLMGQEIKANWTFKATTEDACNIDYDDHTFTCILSDDSTSPAFNETPGVIINTKVSRFDDPQRWYDSIGKNKTLLILVGESDGVKNPYDHLRHFSESFPMDRTMVTNTLKMNNKMYFIKMGYKVDV